MDFLCTSAAMWVEPVAQRRIAERAMGRGDSKLFKAARSGLSARQVDVASDCITLANRCGFGVEDLTTEDAEKAAAPVFDREMRDGHNGRYKSERTSRAFGARPRS
jgi:hypothetical protein